MDALQNKNKLKIKMSTTTMKVEKRGKKHTQRDKFRGKNRPTESMNEHLFVDWMTEWEIKWMTEWVNE